MVYSLERRTDMHSHKIVFTTKALLDVSVTIDLPTSTIDDDLIDSLASVMEIRHGYLVQSRSSVGVAYTWFLDGVEMGGA